MANRKPAKSSTTFILRMDPDLYERVKLEASRRGLPMSHLINQVMEEHLKVTQ